MINIKKDKDYRKIKKFVLGLEKVSCAILQKKYRMGYHRAYKILYFMGREGIITIHDPGKRFRLVIKRNIIKD